MSVQWISWVLEHAEATGSKRLVLLSVANHANGDGVCWPKLDQIAREARLSRRSVEEAMRGLIADGVVARKTGRGRGRPNIYRITPEAVSGERHSGEESSPETDSPENPEDFVNNPEGSSGAIEPSVEPSVEPSEIRDIGAASSPPLLTLVDTSASPSATDLAVQRFEEHFWPAYPRRHGKRVGKAKALERWKKLTIEEQRAAVRGAKHYAAHCQATDTYAKDAERWLRDRCWEDYQQPSQPTETVTRPTEIAPGVFPAASTRW